MTTPSRHELVLIARLRTALRHFASATDAVTEANGLTPRRYDLLAVLHAAPGRSCTATELAELFGTSPSGLTELVTRAQRAGLVERIQDTRDTRVKHVRPTAEGSRRYLIAVRELRSERTRLLEMIDTLRETSLALRGSATPRATKRTPPRRAPSPSPDGIKGV